MVKGVLTGIGAIGLMLGATTVHAQNGPCTLENWTSKVGETNMKVGTPGGENGNRRYAGPCGLNIALKGEEAYLTNEAPTVDAPRDEKKFNVRFYFFLNDVEDDVTFYQALDDTVEVITATYVATGNNANNVSVRFGPSAAATLSVGPVSAGWNSLEIQWVSDSSATLKAILGNASDIYEKTATDIDTNAFAIDSARLGVINALVDSLPTAGSIDFDDYDSRRDTVPGRLLRGDANGDGVTDGDDQTPVVNEFLFGESSAGTADCNEDGEVNGDDQSCIVNIFLFGEDS